MKLTYFLVGIPILVSAFLCIGFYLTHDLYYIHIGLTNLLIAFLLFLDDALVGKAQIPMLVKDLKIKPQFVHQLATGVHFIQEERPEELAEYIDEFLK